MSEVVIEAQNLSTDYKGRLIHDEISFKIYKGEIVALLGGSGSGKSTLLNTMIFLKKPKSGKMLVLQKDIWKLNPKEELKMKLNFGVLFQFGALFSSLNVLDNIGIALKEYSAFRDKEIKELSKMWLSRVGLKMSVAELFPNELSGGMIKRVSLARALVLSPKILFLDEPTSGLDPKSAREFDALILSLRELLGLSIVMVTHDLESVKKSADRLLILKDKKISFNGSLDALEKEVESLDLYLHQI
ncbi:ABC transporter ATP-binding protein [Helicobacter burdigaliensis]|uniref:ABC transporter ATP-binding protein n=1 Tax=Helicobacter burdigaliensis TaxID=2315334 RepID=UPI000EF74C4C|nr:ATP-binding cassette domain-containing protein [Helicobacter burdigaliensis]